MSKNTPTGVYEEDDEETYLATRGGRFEYEGDDEHEHVDEDQDDDGEFYDEPQPPRKPRDRSRQAPRNMSRLPRTQDRRRKQPQVQREAEGDDVVPIEYRGHTYTVLADQDDWSIDAMEAFERNLMFAGVRELLGPKQWEQFKSRHNNRRAFRGFLDEVSEVFGFGNAGN